MKKILPIIIISILILGGFGALSSPAKRANPLMNDDVLDQYQTQYDSELFIGRFSQNYSSNAYAAQSFIPTQPVITRVELDLYKPLTASLPLFAAIRDNLTGVDLTVVSVDAEEINETIDWVEFDFKDLAVIPGETYYIVCYTATDVGNKYYWGWHSTDIYPNGTSYWTDHYLDVPFMDFAGDMVFKTYGRTNTPPGTPEQPEGPTEGVVNVEYIYTTSATDPDDESLEYGWDWDGDGSVDEWTSTETANHIWTEAGSYEVQVKARDEIGELSDFSEPLSVTITVPFPKLNIYAESFIIEGETFEVIVTSDGEPIEDVDIEFNNVIVNSDAEGKVSFAAPLVNKNEYFQIIATKEGYLQGTENVKIIDQDDETNGWIFGIVYNQNGNLLDNVEICFVQNGIESECVISSEQGRYNSPSLSPGVYYIRASRSGYLSQIKNNINVVSRNAKQVDFVLEKDNNPLKEEDSTVFDYLIDESSISEKVGARIDISENEDKKTRYRDEIELEINSVKDDTVSLTIGAPEGSSGTFLIVSIGNKILSDLDNIKITYDSEEIYEETDVASFFTINDDSSPGWLRFQTINGLYIFIRVTKFSEHSISISSITEKIPILILSFIYILIIIIAAVIFTGPSIKNIVYRKFYLKDEER